MNGLDDDDIRARLDALLSDEPPMGSVAVDDLARGRQLLRRRRRTAVVATATALPAVLVGGWAVSTAALGSAGTAVRLQPADGDPNDAGDDGTVTVCWVGSATEAPGDGGVSAVVEPGDPAPQSSPDSTPETTPETTPESAPATADTQRCDVVPWVGDSCTTANLDLSESGGGDRAGTSGSATNDGGTTGVHRGYALTIAPDGSGTIGFACDPLGSVLQQHADPNGAHAGSTASGTAEATKGDGPQSQSASIGWADGDREGQVTLSVGPTADPAACADPVLEAGPDVACEQRTLDDGTVVRVGHGTQDGAERVTVSYDRPDGVTVWATADEATDEWWHGNRQTDALTAPPMTVDDLISMAMDKELDKAVS
jgi:hypothetical protein